MGRLTSVADAAGTLSRSYDEFGNLLTDVRTTSAASLTTAYSYDAANRIASITYPSGALVSYTRDTMGRITGVTAKPSGGTSQAVVSSIAYEPFGPYSGLTYGNGVAEARSFDQDYRLTTLTDTGSSPLQNLTYAYYPTNNVKTITDTVNAGNSQSFIYDNLQRLTQAAGGYGTYGYSYDNDGNRLTQTLGGVTTNYGIGAGNDLLSTISMGSVTTQTIGYTADGRMSSFSPGIQSPGGQYITTLSYNQDARLSAVNTAGGVLASYTYDGFGQRLLKTLSSTNGQIYQYGQNKMLLEETDQSGAAQADYIYLNGRPIATLDPSSGTLYYLHDDILGTPQVATDGSQSTAWQSTYKPFGEASVSGTVTQNLRFPGQYSDSESGWNHNGFRNYIPDLGRYAEPDPLGLQGMARLYDSSTGQLLIEALRPLGAETNSYAYVNNNPASLVDPSGLCPQDRNSQRCKALAQRISNLLDKIDRGQRNIDTNPLQLPEFPPYPGAPPRASVQGHRDLLDKYKQNLADRAHEYNQNCGGGDPFNGGITSPSSVPSSGPSISPNTVRAIVVGGVIVGTAVVCPECLIPEFIF